MGKKKKIFLCGSFRCDEDIQMDNNGESQLLLYTGWFNAVFHLLSSHGEIPTVIVYISRNSCL
jgi:hypothetical protein